MTTPTPAAGVRLCLTPEREAQARAYLRDTHVTDLGYWLLTDALADVIALRKALAEAERALAARGEKARARPTAPTPTGAPEAPSHE